MSDAIQEQAQVVAQEQQQEQQVEAEPQAQETPQEKPKQVADGLMRRFGELTAARRAAEERAAAAEAQLEAYKRNGTEQPSQDHPNVQQLAQIMAEQIASERLQQQTMAERLQKIEKAGKGEFGESFDRSIQNLQLAGVGGPEFLEALTNVQSPEKVVQYLGDPDNVEEALRISQLPPVQMGIEITKLSNKAAKAFAKSLSSAPPPITTIDGKGAPEGAEPDPKNTAAWMEWRQKNARRK